MTARSPLQPLSWAPARGLEIFRCESGPFRDAREHARTNFIGVVEGEDDVGPVLALQDAVRSTRLSLYRPSDSQQGR